MGTIKAVAYLNELTKDLYDYYLVPQVRGTLYQEDIIRRLEAKEIATKNVNGEAFVDLFLEECAIAVGEGYNVITKLFAASVSIRGTIYANQLGHSIEASNLNIRFNLTPGARAREVLSTNTTVEIAEQSARKGPVIQKISNPTSTEPNTLASGCMVLIEGMRIAIRGDQTERIGVFFVNADSGQTVRIPPSHLSPNVPTKLQLGLPAAVTPGEWRVRVATQATTNTSLSTKEVREYEFPQLIVVV